MIAEFTLTLRALVIFLLVYAVIALVQFLLDIFNPEGLVYVENKEVSMGRAFLLACLFFIVSIVVRYIYRESVVNGSLVIWIVINIAMSVAVDILFEKFHKKVPAGKK